MIDNCGTVHCEGWCELVTYNTRLCVDLLYRPIYSYMVNGCQLEKILYRENMVIMDD